MLVSENAKICVSPDAKPQRKPVEYRLRWVPGIGSLRWACTFHIFCVDFICVWWPTQTQFSVEYGLNPLQFLNCFISTLIFIALHCGFQPLVSRITF